ncbi:MAG: hypothetical protein K2I79_03980 [Clostridia bacterium]|nr:hypothetical protein [Clostridia bacterium]
MGNSGYILCHHHSNCHDRPAVAQCSKCGKGLCVECADKLKSADGKVVCVDCLNQELAENAAVANLAKNSIKRELILIVVGFIIGLIAFIFLAQTGFAIIAWILPTTLASLGTIIKLLRYWSVGIILKILFFIILIVVSPIMFIWRIVSRLKDISVMKKYAQYQKDLSESNNQYFMLARQMNTRLESMEDYKKKLQVEYADLLATNKAEAEKNIAKLEAEYAEKLNQERVNTENMEAELSKLSKLYAASKAANNTIANIARGPRMF